MSKEILLDMLHIQLGEYKVSLSYQNTEHMRAYYRGKVNATLDIIDRVHILYMDYI